MGSRWCILATKELNYQELKDIIYGAAFLGAGGGGSVVQGMAMVKEVVNSGKKVVLVDLDSVRDDGLAAVSAGMGSPAAAKHGWRNEHLPAFDLLEKYLGKKVDYVVPIEIGAGNIAVPLHTAAFRSKYLVDADGAGRAIPELELTTFEIYGVPISPMAISDWEGDGAILFTKDSLKAERIARQIVVAFEGCAGIALYPMSGAQLKNVVIPGTISLSQKVGSLLRRVREENLDVCEVLPKELGGYILGVGKVTSKTLEMRGGFDFGVVEVDKDRHVRLFGTPGQERFSFLWRPLSIGMDGYILMIDSGDPESLKKAEKIYKFFRKLAPRTPHVIAVNKYDRPGFKVGCEDVRKLLEVPPTIPVKPTIAINHDSALSLVNALLKLIDERGLVTLREEV